MSRRLHVAVIGAGKRVAEDVLPVFDAAPGRLELSLLLARRSRKQELAGRARSIMALDQALAEGRLADCDLVYLVVAKGAVPGVLQRLTAAGPPCYDLLLETPGLLFKHLGHLRRLSPFARVWMAEDSVDLPWVALARRAAGSGPLGRLREVRLCHSAWRYHGVALLKALFDAPVTSARRRALPAGGAELRFRFRGGGRGVILEPRDYQQGHVLLVGERASASDAPEREPGSLPLVRWSREDAVADGVGGSAADAGAAGPPSAVGDGGGHAGTGGLALGDLRIALDPVQLALLGPARPDRRLTAQMHGLKRVGLLAMLLRLAEGGAGYPLGEGLDDMAIDWSLEKFSRWFGAPPWNLRAPLGRGLLGGLLRPLARGG